MTAQERQQRARRRLLNVLPRVALEEMADTERPWALSRDELVRLCIPKWDRDFVQTHLSLVFDTASREPEPRP